MYCSCTFDPEAQEAEEDLSKFETSLVYREPEQPGQHGETLS